MPRNSWKPSAESFAIGSIIVSLLIAGALSFVPRFAFGTFQFMATVLVVSDLVLYVLVKLGVARPSRHKVR